MSYTFEQFCSDCRDVLTSQPGPNGREKVRSKLEDLLKEPDFLKAECGFKAKPGIRTIYRDKETGFNVLVHVYDSGKKGPPHDHGKSWAVYGQAEKWTDMTLWKCTDDGLKQDFSELKEDRSFRLEAGKAGTFEIGEIHSIQFPDGARFVRVTGTDLDKIPTKRYNLEQKTVNTGSRLYRETV